LFVSALLCLILLAHSCIEPAAIDMSRTTVMITRQGDRSRAFPYEVVHILGLVCLMNVALSVIAIPTLKVPGGFRAALSPSLHFSFLPLSIVCALGDMAMFLAVAAGGGPLYSAIYSSRIMIIGILSKILLGRLHRWRQWGMLMVITLAAVWYSLGAASEDSGVLTTAVFSLTKALFSGVGAVLTEAYYKERNLWLANFVSQLQSFVVILVLALCLHRRPRCGSQADEEGPCIEVTSWDSWTWLVVAFNFIGGWLGVLIVVRISAMCRIICKSAVTPVLYFCYAIAFPTFEPTWQRSVAVLVLAAGIFCYSCDRLLDKVPVPQSIRESDEGAEPNDIERQRAAPADV